MQSNKVMWSTQRSENKNKNDILHMNGQKNVF